jgi:hypothetical protein
MPLSLHPACDCRGSAAAFLRLTEHFIERETERCCCTGEAVAQLWHAVFSDLAQALVDLGAQLGELRVVERSDVDHVEPPLADQLVDAVLRRLKFLDHIIEVAEDALAVLDIALAWLAEAAEFLL